MSGDRAGRSLSQPQLGDNPDLLRVPREFLLEVEQEHFERDVEMAQLVTRLPKFAQTFFLIFCSEELGMEISGLGEADRQAAIARTVELEQQGDRETEVALLHVFSDFCELYVETEELSTPEKADEHQPEILALTARLLERIGEWAEEGDRPRLGELAAELAWKMNRL